MAASEAQNTKVSARPVTSLKSLSSSAKGLPAFVGVWSCACHFLLLFSFWAHFLVLGPAEGRGEDDWVAYQRPDSGAT